MGLVPKIPEAPERARPRLTRAVNGVRDLWHRWRADGWRRGRTHRSIRRLRHGLAGSRGSGTRTRWRRRRVGHRRIRSGLAGHSQRTGGDDHARDRDPRGVGGWCGALSFGHESWLSSLVAPARTPYRSSARRRTRLASKASAFPRAASPRSRARPSRVRDGRQYVKGKGVNPLVLQRNRQRRWVCRKPLSRNAVFVTRS